MKRLLKRLAIILLMILIISLAWIYRPYHRYDPEKVVPEVSSLKEPFQTIESACYLDGGTVGIRILDADGVEKKFSFPAYLIERDRKYPELFVGALYYRDDEAIEIEFNEDTKLRLLEILREAEGIDKYRDLAIASLSDRWRDYGTFIIRRFVTKDY